MQDGNTFKTNFSLPNAISTMIWSGFWIAGYYAALVGISACGSEPNGRGFCEMPTGSASLPTAARRVKADRWHQAVEAADWSTYERLRARV